VFELDVIAGGIGKFDFFDDVVFVWVFKHDNIIGGIGKHDFFNNVVFV
jgi:hypothetical protein